MTPLVFDLDGTLVDSAPDLQAGMNRLLGAAGRPPLTLEEARGFIGHGAASFVARACAARQVPAADRPALLADFLRDYTGFVGLTLPYPGAMAALRALRAAGHPLGLCTNKPAAATGALLGHLGLSGLFGTVICGDSLPVQKPDPAPLNAAFAALGGRGLFIGDSEVDAATAHAAGVPFVLFAGGYRRAAADSLNPAAVFDDHAALPALVAGMAR